MKGAAILITLLGIASVVYSHGKNVCKDWNKEVYLRNPWDCSSFFQCDNGKLVLQECPSGLHFNRQLNVCDYPENAQCKRPQKCWRPNQPGNSEVEGNAGKLVDGDDYFTMWKYCNVRGDGYLLPSIADCTKFYECVYGEPVEMFCYPGLFYSDKIKGCDYEENVQCATSYP